MSRTWMGSSRHARETRAGRVVQAATALEHDTMTYMCTYVGRPGTRTQARAYVRREAWQDAQAQPFHTHERARVRTSSTLARTSVNPPTHNHAPYYHSPDGHMYARAQGGLARRTSSTLARTSVNPSTHNHAPYYHSPSLSPTPRHLFLRSLLQIGIQRPIYL